MKYNRTGRSGLKLPAISLGWWYNFGGLDVLETGRAIARSASHGVIIKGSNYLEDLSKVKTLIVDKTGTLTRGQIKVLHLFTFDKHRPTDALKEAASIASISSHPISQAIVRFATEHRLSFPPPKDFHELPGLGITAHDHLGNFYALGTIGQHHIHNNHVRHFVLSLFNSFQTAISTNCFIAMAFKKIGSSLHKIYIIIDNKNDWMANSPVDIPKLEGYLKGITSQEPSPAPEPVPGSGCCLWRLLKRMFNR